MPNKKYVALDSGNGLVDGGTMRTIRGWRQRAERSMPADLRAVGFVAFTFLATADLRGFEYVRMSYGKRCYDGTGR